MVSNQFLTLLAAVPFALAGPCKPQSSSVAISESILSTSLLETAITAVSEVTVSTSMLETTTTEVPIENSEAERATITTTETLATTTLELSTGITTDTTVEITPTTLATSLNTAEATTGPATTSSQVPAPSMVITCPTVNNQCLNNVKVECDRLLGGGYNRNLVLPNLDECARQCIDDLACTAFTWLSSSNLCLIAFMAITPDRVTGPSEGAVAGVRGRCTQ